ncbi:hypothetical protein PN36_24775 [Candidatus Thiomargarita nelsonii]|uniref:Uncharacterized protein n=1 Tax=Candidatus Thiomargarita nelsonii TaxID=1003181 RepID=A0A0A6S5Z5_9GAMM|nr:hypothetical protein PN36_24775 [Candidatus Thiomargarita nelsonii]
MLVCHGVVKKNVIFIPHQVQLLEGMTVEVRIPSSSEKIQMSSTEEQFKHKLLELGLLTEIKKHISTVPIGEPPLAQIQGKPLSQLIIEERR